MMKFASRLKVQLPLALGLSLISNYSIKLPVLSADQLPTTPNAVNSGSASTSITDSTKRLTVNTVAIRNIYVNENKQLVIEFDNPAHLSPVTPQVRDYPGQKHDIVLEFPQTSFAVDKAPKARVVLDELMKVYPDLNSLSYATASDGTKSRIRIGVSANVSACPSLAKIDQESAVINLTLSETNKTTVASANSVADAKSSLADTSKRAHINTTDATASSTPDSEKGIKAKTVNSIKGALTSSLNAGKNLGKIVSINPFAHNKSANTQSTPTNTDITKTASNENDTTSNKPENAAQPVAAIPSTPNSGELATLNTPVTNPADIAPANSPSSVSTTAVPTSAPATTVSPSISATTVPTSVSATTVSPSIPATTVPTSVSVTTVSPSIPATTVPTSVSATTAPGLLPATTQKNISRTSPAKDILVTATANPVSLPFSSTAKPSSEVASLKPEITGIEVPSTNKDDQSAAKDLNKTPVENINLALPRISANPEENKASEESIITPLSIEQALKEKASLEAGNPKPPVPVADNINSQPASIESKAGDNSFISDFKTSFSKPVDESKEKNDLATKPNAESTDKNDLAIKPNAESADKNDLAIKPNAESTDKNDLAIKPNAESTDKNDLAIKPNAESTDKNDLAIKPNAESTDKNDIAIKPNGESTDKNDIVIKPNAESADKNDIAIKPNGESKNGETEKVASLPPNPLDSLTSAAISNASSGSEAETDAQMSAAVKLKAQRAHAGGKDYFPPKFDDEAIEHYNAAVRAHLNGKLAEAITEYKTAIDADEKIAEAYSNLGLIYNQLHKYDLAMGEFHKALAINPKDAITYNGIGAAMRAKNNLLAAIKNWQTAISLDPNLASAHYNLGTAYEINKDLDKALAQYKEAIKHDDKLGEAYYRMGLILQKMNNKHLALEEYRQAIKISQQASYVPDAKRRINLLSQSKNNAM